MLAQYDPIKRRLLLFSAVASQKGGRGEIVFDPPPTSKKNTLKTVNSVTSVMKIQMVAYRIIIVIIVDAK